MNDKDFIDKIKDITDDTPIPEKIQPSSIEQLLKDKKQKKSNPIIKYSAIAASILVIGLSITILNINSNLSILDNDNENSNLDTTYENVESQSEVSDESFTDTAPISESVNDEDVIPVNSDMVAKSYEQIHKIFEDTYTKYSYDYIDGDMVNFVDEAVAESATEATQATSDTSNSGNKSSDYSGSGNKNNDFSTTNTQVEGIDEGDIVKTDGKYIYTCNITDYSSVITVDITKTNNGKLSDKGQILIEDEKGETLSVQEMYISDNKLIVIASKSISQRRGIFNTQVFNKNITITYIYDVSNINSPTLISSLQQDGFYKTSRKSGDIVYVFTHYNVNYFNNVSKEKDYIPYVGTELLDYTDIYIPETTQSNSYLVLTSIDLNDAKDFIDSKAILASADVFYVSSENIYASEYVWEYSDNYNNHSTNQSQLLKISYDKGTFYPEGIIKIKGTLNNQFSLDEYDGYLRVVTTVNNTHRQTDGSGQTTNYSNYNTNSLYVIDSNLDLVGKIENIAKDELIYSARFYGDTGYFVTYRNTDPLFSVDLSDPTHPEIIGALKIPGFSTYMHFYGEGKLLGIGQETDPETGAFLGMKLSMFDISDPSDVKEVDKYILDDVFWSEALYNHKAILVNSDKNIIGFTTCQYYYDPWEEQYVYNTFSYDDKKGFINHTVYKLYDSETDYIYNYGYDYTRGLYIGEYLYVDTPSVGINSYLLGSDERVDNIEFDN